MKDLHIALIQTDILWEIIEGNLQNFSELLSHINQPVDLIVLPEMFSTGFSMHSKDMAENIDGKAVNWMKDMAEQKNSCITGSLIIEEEGKYFNRLIWVTPEGTFSHYDKRHLFRLSGEQDHFSAGNKKLIVELKGWKICPQICYDLRFPVWVRNKENYDLLLYVANWPTPRKKVWQILLQARAIENISFVIGVNRIGKDENGYEYSGNSMVIDPKGEIISEIPEGEERVEIVKLSYNELQQFREKFPAWLDADDFEVKI
ncbi:MAG: amidohydrolase [Bacteroidales bacterium]|nr:amidohydrolase [Bacteroidales bacterium]MCF8455936.1 amidohydrolase [Bacteroidales bacterium]